MCPVTNIFTAKGRQWLARLDLLWVDRMTVGSYLKMLDGYDLQVDTITAKIASISKEDRNVRLSITIQRIDYLTALTVISEIVDIRRFLTPWKLVAYAGLAPSGRDSGQTRHSGRITT